MADFISMSIRDKGGELGRLKLPVGDAVALDGDPSFDADYAALGSAIEAIILGVVARVDYVRPSEEDGDYPTSNFAQREFGLRILMDGIVSGNAHSITIPTIDLDVLTLVAERDDVLLADGGVMAALVTAIEARVQYDYGAGFEGVVVRQAYVVGRNN